MATILSGYAYTTTLDRDGLALKNAAAFNPEFDTPILKDHAGSPVGYLLAKRHDAKGMLIDVLVDDDALAETVKGFSIRTKKKAYATSATGMPLDEISICKDLTPRNPDCIVTARRHADHMHVSLALYGQKIGIHCKLMSRAVAALKAMVELQAKALVK